MTELIILVASLLTGSITTDTQTPVANAVVSDGFSVVRTDADGNYSMPYNDSAQYVFVSVPSGYDFPKDSTGTATIWQRVDKSASAHTHNFTLHAQTDGGQADSSHVLLVFGDPQVLDDYNVWRLRNETFADVKKLQASYPAGTKFIGITVGDLVWDRYSYFPDQKASYELLDFPNFFAIGNHDHKSGTTAADTAKIDSIAALEFEQYFGPTYYSFNVGAVHYVVLDNVYYNAGGSAGKNYQCLLTPKQKNWVKKDIAELQEGTQVVFAFHINASNNGSDRKYLQNLVERLNCTNYILSGHVHDNTVSVHADNFIEHNIAAASGNFWCSDWCGDGSPNGYKVFETGEQGINYWYYKGTGCDKDFRMKTYPVNSINAGNTKQNRVLANIWDYDKNCKVNIWENGVESEMDRFTGKDPDTYDVQLDDGDTRPNYPGTEGGTIASKNPGATQRDHFFSYKPKDANAEMVVVFTDRFGNDWSAPVLRHQMVASFTPLGDDLWQYSQDFNSLPIYPNYVESGTTLARGTWVAGHTPMGWYAANSKKSLPTEKPISWIGYNHIYVSNGSESKGWIYSFGSVDADPANNGSDRALGSMNSTTQKRISYAVLLENNTGGVITSMDVTYTGEVWRIGTNVAAQENLECSFAILTDEQAQDIRDRKAWIGEIETTPLEMLKFTTPTTVTQTANAAIDGNATNNRQEVHGSFELEAQPGQVIMLRWDDDIFTDNDDQALAIDDVNIIATSEEPISALPQVPMLHSQQDTRTILRNGQVWIQTPKSTYSIIGQERY